MKMIIGGKHVEAADKKTFDVIAPATMKKIDAVPMATKADVDGAIENARKGAKEWADVPMYQRIEAIYRFADLLEQPEHFKKLVEFEIEENGKPISMAEEDIHVSAYICRAFAEKARNFSGEIIPAASEPGTKDDLIMTFYEPLGIVVCIVPFNYPTNLYCFKAVPALLMGNAVIVKPASDTPLANIYITNLLLEAGILPNAIQIVTGRGGVLGNWLIDNPYINAVSITGSSEAGKQIMANCANNLHHCHLELGGNDPMIIFDDCNLDLAIQEVISGRIGNAGQTCCASKRYIVQNTIKDKFVEKLKDALAQVKIGDLRDCNTNMGPVISEKAAIEVENQINHTIKQGARLVYGGKRYDYTFIEPTLLDNVTPDMNVAKEMEIFGPVFPVIGFDITEEAIAIANNIPYGLQSAVMTEDIKKAFYVARHMEAGACIVNGSSNYRHNHQAFGGRKNTGIGGHEGVAYTLKEMCNTKTIALKQIFAD